jgi:hypothetical protein
VLKPATEVLRRLGPRGQDDERADGSHDSTTVAKIY